MFKEYLTDGAQKAKILLPEDKTAQLEHFYKMLIEKNKVMNLTAITDAKEIALKHMIDSLLLYDPKVFSGAKICDVGTGAGFPGMPLKIYDDSLKVTLMDSLAKRLKFLDEVIASLALKDISTCHVRAEDAGRANEHREFYDIVCARAVASLPVLAEYCLPLVAVGGLFLAMKASKYQDEIQTAQRAIGILGGKIEQVKKVQLPDLPDERFILYVRKERCTPKKYPRKAGTAEKSPL